MKKALLYINNISDILLIASDSFKGDFKIKNTSFVEIKNSVINNAIPNITEDRINLKNDLINISNDYRKALNEKKK